LDGSIVRFCHLSLLHPHKNGMELLGRHLRGFVEADPEFFRNHADRPAHHHPVCWIH